MRIGEKIESIIIKVLQLDLLVSLSNKKKYEATKIKKGRIREE